MVPPAPYFRDGGRSFSLTSAGQAPTGLTNYRSLTSLRGNEPYHRPRSPYKYPTRLKRPGYRPSSPALSDMTGLQLTRSQHTRLGSGLRTTGLPLITRPTPLPATGLGRSNPSIHSIGAYEHTPGADPGPRRRTPSLSSRSVPVSMTPGGYAAVRYANAYTGSRGGTPSNTEQSMPVTLATDSPALQSNVSSGPSSDPPNSAPPTPRDAASIGSAEPTILQNGSMPTRDSTPVLVDSPVYYDYGEQYDQVEKHVIELYHQATSAPIPMGFVQRIRNILEERSVLEQNGSLHVPKSSLVELLPGVEVHELPATPVASPMLKRITRELILANLNPSSDGEGSASPTINQVLGSKPENSNPQVGGHSPFNKAKETAPPEHQSHRSVASQAGTSQSNSTVETAALVDYALPLHYEMRSTMSLDAYMRDDTTEAIVAPSHESPTEPVTIATAELEVAAPTPTHVSHLPWSPKFDNPIDLIRPQSAVVASSDYSSSHRDMTNRFSTPPATRTDWPLMNEISITKRSSSSRSQICNASPLIPQEPNRDSVVNRPRRLSGTNLAQRVSEAHHARRMSDNLRVYGASSSQHIQKQLDNQHVQFSSPGPHVQQPSNGIQDRGTSSVLHALRGSDVPNLPVTTIMGKAMVQEARNSFVFPAARYSIPGNSTILLPTQNPKFVDSSMSPVSEYQRRDSVAANSSPVSPLGIDDRDVGRPDSMSTTQLTNLWSYRKPVPKRSSSPISLSTRNSLKDVDLVKEQSFDTSTTDLRFSQLRPLNRQLDDVKEEPTLECSSTDLRSSTFRFPLPQRKSSLTHFECVRLSRDYRRNSSPHNYQLEREFSMRPKSQICSTRTPSSKDSLLCPPSGAMSLADMRSIPSLNFSRVDLFAKLNDELELRRTSICDKFPQLEASPATRPLSNGLMREKYKSFFQTLDGMTCDKATDIQVTQMPPPSRPLTTLVSPRDSWIVPSRLRPMSAKEFIAELDRISIPSIQGLTQRLSELLPSLKRYYGDNGDILYEEDDETVRTAIEEIRMLGHAALADFSEGDKTAALIKSGVIAGLLHSRADSLAGSENILMVPRPRSASSPGLHSHSHEPAIAELEAPCAAVLRSRSMSEGTHTACVISQNTAPNLARISERSNHRSPGTSRPWNVDSNYPWANTVPSIDISLPAPTLRRDAVKQRPSKLRLRLSRDASTSSNPATEIGSMLTALADLTDSTGGATADTFSHNHKRRVSKRSLLGSIGRKMRLGNSFDQGGFATGPDILRGEDRTVDPGDRYPTTGLSPPSALNIDEVRSFFSDDSSAHGDAAYHGISFRKRLTNLRTRLPPIARAHSAMEHRSIPHGPDLRRSNSLFASNETPVATVTSPAVYPDGVVGMPRTEFRAKKLVERMKSLWYRSGEILRGLSGKKKSGNRERNDWESLREGVEWNNI
jgi:serine/arginine repetitive matrix protein 2